MVSLEILCNHSSGAFKSRTNSIWRLFLGRRTLDKATRDLLATEKKLSSKAVNGHVFLASNTCHHVLGLILIRIGTNEHCTTIRRPVFFNARKE